MRYAQVRRGWAAADVVHRAEMRGGRRSAVEGALSAHCCSPFSAPASRRAAAKLGPACLEALYQRSPFSACAVTATAAAEGMAPAAAAGACRALAHTSSSTSRSSVSSTSSRRVPPAQPRQARPRESRHLSTAAAPAGRGGRGGGRGAGGSGSDDDLQQLPGLGPANEAKLRGKLITNLSDLYKVYRDDYRGNAEALTTFLVRAAAGCAAFVLRAVCCVSTNQPAKPLSWQPKLAVQWADCSGGSRQRRGGRAFPHMPSRAPKPTSLLSPNLHQPHPSLPLALTAADGGCGHQEALCQQHRKCAAGPCGSSVGTGRGGWRRCQQRRRRGRQPRAHGHASSGGQYLGRQGGQCVWLWLWMAGWLRCWLAAEQRCVVWLGGNGGSAGRGTVRQPAADAGLSLVIMPCCPASLAGKSTFLNVLSHEDTCLHDILKVCFNLPASQPKAAVLQPASQAASQPSQLQSGSQPAVSGSQPASQPASPASCCQPASQPAAVSQPASCCLAVQRGVFTGNGCPGWSVFCLQTPHEDLPVAAVTYRAKATAHATPAPNHAHLSLFAAPRPALPCEQVVQEPVQQWQEYRCRDIEGNEKMENVLEVRWVVSALWDVGT